MQKVVIIGASHAGVDAAFSLRRFGFSGEIILMSKEKEFPYQKPPLSKSYLSNEIEDDKLLLKPKHLFEKNNIKVLLGIEIAKIDRHKKCLTATNNQEFIYDFLIISSGTNPRKLKVSEDQKLNLHYLRTQADAVLIKDNLKDKARVLIIGAGYIGLEIAAALKKLGHSITLLEREENVLSRVTGKAIANFLLNYHQQKGIVFKFNTQKISFERNENQTFVKTETEKIHYDICIVGIGVIVNAALAKQAGLKVDNGIWVNEKCQTEDEAVYAIGDCSNHYNKFAGERIRLESVPNAMGQAKVAASNICGKESTYKDIPWFWSNQYDLKLQTVGIFKGFTDSIVRKDNANSIAVFYYKHNQLIACDAINQPKDYMVAKKMIEQNLSPSKDSLKNMALDIKEIYGQCLDSN